ncbi:MAG: type I secretion system permease/ATPase [Paracoccus denitrificans]|nr:MAG: type I secretion system permease/ATPase [Paracoccus denitrificans]PZO85259.1 MAG: type I secretion system permease/ATPase [Paracoccus denitrificans]
MMPRTGFAELRAARRDSLWLVLCVGLFSTIVSVLGLTGPLFMMQVYDRVLSSRSVETLTALFLLATVMFLAMGLLDLSRGLVMNRVAARFHARMEQRVFRASLGEPPSPASGPRAGLRELDAIQRLLQAPVLMAMFDAPWAPLFLIALFVFHPMLGLVATVGGALLVLAAVLNQILTRNSLQASLAAGQRAQRTADLFADESEVMGALGMERAAMARWRRDRDIAADETARWGDRAASLTVFSRTFRIYLQSVLLATGAWLVLRHQITPGAMIASSIMMGRALAPIEQLVAGWPLVQPAIDGWRRVGELLSRHPTTAPRTALPRPAAELEVTNLGLIPPGGSVPTLRNVSFSLKPGQALGVVGASGAGKSSLARVLIGAWTPTSGTIRLGGATLDHYDPDQLGRMLGYLPQRVTLFDGSIAENIGRLAPDADPKAVVDAAKAARAHQMILSLPQGYDTPITQAGPQLSGGQIQRIGLARALFGAPLLFVLDEPNASLDADGSEALNAAIRDVKQRGGAVVIMAHRPAAIAECDFLLVLDSGAMRAFGPRDQVMRASLTTATPPETNLGTVR